MRTASGLRSLRAKLIAAFLLVSVVPMLIATELATEVVTRTFESNLRTWLYETSRFFFGNMLDERREELGVLDSMIDDGLLSAVLAKPDGELPEGARKLMEAVGYDLLVVYDSENRVVYASRSVTDLESAPVAAQASLYRLKVDGVPLMMAAASRPAIRGDGSYRVLLGIFIDENYIANINALKSFEMRLFFRQKDKGDPLLQFYSSREGAREARPLKASIAAALESGEPYVFRRGAEGGGFVGVYSPLNDAKGDLLGVIFCGLRLDEGVVGWISRTRVFIAIFLIGSALAILGGLLLSRQLTRPLLRLVKGVQAVAAGDFTQRVAVTGHDEVSQLSEAFNDMTGELARLREVEAGARRQERLSTLGEVAAGLAHEIRNPLGIIKTTAELLQHSPRLEPTELRRLGYVAEEVRRIDGLLKDFLGFARAPQVTMEVQPSEIVARVLSFAAQEAERRGVATVFRDQAPDAVVRGDPGQIHDAVLNLVLNALDAMPGGGQLTVEQRATAGEVTMIFSDTGTGVSDEVLPRLYTPFATSKPTGTGLGLAKVFAVMASHGGHVEYKGSRTGAVFELVFPRLHPEQGAIR